MKSRAIISITICAASLAFGQSGTSLSPTGSLEIVRQPPPFDFVCSPLKSLSSYDPKKAGEPYQVDLRGFDLSQWDVGDRLADLLHAEFDSNTKFPAKLPAGFDPARFMELGKDPGLGVRKLHANGITGKGVGIGIIDQTFLVNHVEFAGRLRLYEEIHDIIMEAQMHGPAVASIAVGKTVGVAPEADLYYMAITPPLVSGDFTWLAKAIDRLLEINATLPKERSIRVISISQGWTPEKKGYREVMAAVEKAKKAGVFVISTALWATHSLALNGMGREPLADPNIFVSYGPGSFWAPGFWGGKEPFVPKITLLVPMDSRCVASPTGSRDYVFYPCGGESWSVPWIAGLYALACQVKPDITPERFWAAALKTGETIHIRKDNAEVAFGTIANPMRLIESLQRDKQVGSPQTK